MNSDNNNKGKNNESADQQKEEQHVQNPFEKGEGKEITQEDIDNEQRFKEALSERD